MFAQVKKTGNLENGAWIGCENFKNPRMPRFERG